MNFVKRQIINLGRKRNLKKITKNMGEIVEEPDKFICYIKQEKLNKNINFGIIDHLDLFGLIATSEDKKMLKKYDLTKPIYYVFDNIVFDNTLSLSSVNSNVIIKNCTFKGTIELRWNENITFENNKYEATKPLFVENPCFIYDRRGIGNITFINENIGDSKDKNQSLDNIVISLKASNIRLINTSINISNPGILILKANEINIENSSISGEKVSIVSNSINFENSKIKANEAVTIKNKNNDFGGKVISPIVVYNNVDLSEKEGITYIDKETVNQRNDELRFEKELKNARLLLIEKLKEIRDNCNKVNDKEIEKLRNEIERKSVHKVLSKTK